MDSCAQVDRKCNIENFDLVVGSVVCSGIEDSCVRFDHMYNTKEEPLVGSAVDFGFDNSAAHTVL